MVADFRLQKPDPHRIRIRIGGSNITVEYDVSTPTADLSTDKILINRTLSTPKREMGRIRPHEHVPEYKFKGFLVCAHSHLKNTTKIH